MLTDRDAMICAVKARTDLELAKAELPGQAVKIEAARQLLLDSDYAGAKAIVIALFEQADYLPENLSYALSFILLAMGESIEPLLDYIKVKEQAKDSDPTGAKKSRRLSEEGGGEPSSGS